MKEQHKMETSYSSMMSAIKTLLAYTENMKVKVVVLIIKFISDNILKSMKLIKIKSTLLVTLIDILLLYLGPVYKKWIEKIAIDGGDIK
ncbi:hypothetical protein ACERII_05670 [Evansella sp. AB-rgal1]|uniref:hypothetical protein n=1 Tax=Evansella sp. AB-rgal1 TaxID=3242696 RepID=UPI00359DF7BB